MFKNKAEFKAEFTNRIVESYGTSPAKAHPSEQYLALGEIVRDYGNVNWKDTKAKEIETDCKQVYYFSMEFLLGKLMTSNLKNLGIYDIVVDGLKELGINYADVARIETDPGLGNGGLGRLAACFMDSAASLNYPVNGNCIRYTAGLFRQAINKEGEQVEFPDMWLRIGNPWEVRKPKHAVDVKLYGHLDVTYDSKGDMHFAHVGAQHILAVPYDMALIGDNTKMTNTLRLWAAEPADIAPRGIDYRKYLSDVYDICLNVYPDDSTEEGKYLRLKQQYFFGCAGINSIISDYRRKNKDLSNLGKKVAIQLNDTHPVLAVPELMRVLMDVHGYQWDEASRITTEVMSYTNHTVMSEALEKWPVRYIQVLLPRIYMIIEEIDRRFCQYVRDHCPDDPAMIDRVRIIKDDQVHMANLAIICSHSINGVARIHSDILKNDLFRDYYRLFPERFSNKTNGITPRRWMLYSNPELKALIDSKIGTGYHSDYRQFERLMDFVDDPEVQQAFLNVKQQCKWKFADYIEDITNIKVDPESIFDTQAKRLHAYKRQLLNVMNIIYRYQRIKSDPNYKMYPHTYLFAAKAASSYAFAKKVIKLINCVAKKVNDDPDVKGMIKVVFLPNYNVSMSEIMVPATDVSEQISTAGKEASGTGNMKFMMNGAMTLGTLDGANIEIDELVGRENDVIFGLTVDEINSRRYGYYARGYFDGDERIRKVLNSLIDGTWSDNRDDFRLIYDEILMKNDEYFLLADFDSYLKAQDEIERRYLNRNKWARSCLINIAKSGYFSSDRTIEEYVDDIWKIEKLNI